MKGKILSIILVSLFFPSSFILMANPQVYLFSDGFESGNFSAWRGDEGGIVVTDEISYSGTYGAEAHSISGSMPVAMRNLEQRYNTLYAETMVMWSIPPNKYHHLDVFKIIGMPNCVRGALAGIKTFYDNTVKWQLKCWIGSSLQTFTSSQQVNPQANTWYEIQLKAVYGSTDGEYRMWVNGVELSDVAQVGVDSSNQNIFNEIRISAQYSGGDSGYIWYDDVICDEDFITGNPPPPPIQYNLAIDSTVGGTTNPLSRSYIYNENTQVEVTAIPSFGYDFEKWTLNTTEYQINPIIVNMTSNWSLVAYFVEETILPQQLNRTYSMSAMASTDIVVNVYLDSACEVLLSASSDWGIVKNETIKSVYIKNEGDTAIDLTAQIIDEVNCVVTPSWISCSSLASGSVIRLDLEIRINEEGNMSWKLQVSAWRT